MILFILLLFLRMCNHFAASGIRLLAKFVCFWSIYASSFFFLSRSLVCLLSGFSWYDGLESKHCL